MDIEVFRGKDGWRWRLRFRNGRIAASSEAYARRSGAMKSARSAARALGVRVEIVGG